MRKITYIAGCLMMIGAFQSCKKDKQYDVQGDKDVKFFTNNETLGNAPVNSISYAIVNIPDAASAGWVNLSTSLPAQIKFPVFATKPVSQNVTVQAELDNSLIEAYNSANNTNYVPFPADALNTAALSAQILAGQTISADSITINTNTASLPKMTEKSYMAPIRLKSTSNTTGAIAGNSTSSVTYIVADVELRRIKYGATAADAIGSLITPRTGWGITLTPTPSTVGNVVDGSTTTFSRWSASPAQVDVNLQTEKNVTGIRLYTTNSATNIPTQVDVMLSNDGINYTLVGSPLRANLTYASSYNYILFYKPIPAKYIRLNLYYSTSTSTNNFRLAELDVYAN